MSSVHGEALGWPRHPVRNTWDDPTWASLFDEQTRLGWPLTATGLVDQGGEPDHVRPPTAPADDVSRETTTDEGAVSRETSTEVNGVGVAGPGPDPAPGDVPVLSRRVPPMPPSSDGPADRPRPWVGTRVMTVANQKGGVGKTTTAVNIAAAMADAGLRVLVVDMDPQGNASTALSIPHASGTTGIYDVLIDGVPLADVVVESPHVPGLFGAPATIDLAGAEIELVPLVARENRLRRALTTFLQSRPEGRGFDLVLIDCPPSLGLLTVNSFVAADEVLIPIQCEYYALEGLSQLVKNVELIQQHLNAGLRISTILLTMYDARTRLSAEVAQQVREHFGDRVLRAAIPRSVRISEAPSHGETVITYDPTSTGALSYVEAAAQMRQQEVSV